MAAPQLLYVVLGVVTIGLAAWVVRVVVSAEKPAAPPNSPRPPARGPAAPRDREGKDGDEPPAPRG